MTVAATMTTVAFVLCHGAPADHCATFAEHLQKRGYSVQFYASGPALQKLTERKIALINSFSLENLTPDQKSLLAAQIAKACKAARAVITDVGDPFGISIQNALATEAPDTTRCAYYDNPESYVPGGYSETAAKVMRAADRVLFANAHLAAQPVFCKPGEPIDLEAARRIAIGYYPTAAAERTLARRGTEQAAVRAQFFAQVGLKDEGQRIIVYFGGNNEEYFSQAFPAFLNLLPKVDLANTIVLIQQHPGAKPKNLDGAAVAAWKEKNHTPLLLMSPLTSDDAQVLAAAEWHYQTSMAAAFALAGIPGAQIGHKTYEDILIRNGLCPSITTPEALAAWMHAWTKTEKVSTDAVIKGLGICKDWPERLEAAITGISLSSPAAAAAAQGATTVAK